MERQNLITIHWKEDYKTKLKDYIMKEEKTIKYLKLIIEYFENNNIERYNKFDKRDFNKINDYLKSKKMIYYNNCCDNVGVFVSTSIAGSKTLYLDINNEQQYNSDIEIYYQHLDNTIDFNNVLEIAKNRLQYVEEKYKENKKLLKNFDKCMQDFNNKVKDFKKFIDKTYLNNIIDIFIYANEND